MSSWIWLYFAVTAAFTALCLLGWYYSSRSMARAAEKPSFIEEMEGDEKGHAVGLQQVTSTGGREEGEVSPSIVQQPSGGVRVVRGVTHSKGPVATVIGDDGGHVPVSSHAGLAPERAYWDASSIWGTQSYRPSGKACAMCAELIE